MSPDLKEKIRTSIDRLKAFAPPEGYYLAFSGGKDSVAVKALMDMAGVKYDAEYRITSVDPPELVRFIKDQHPDVKRVHPRYSDGKPITMWNLIPRKAIPPTRIVRFCCQYLKESAGDGRMTVTGVRWDESYNRQKNQGVVSMPSQSAANELSGVDGFERTGKGGVILVNDNAETRRVVEQCYTRHKTTLNPIIDWTAKDVWDFIKGEGVSYCSLYDEGFTRLGCIGCPMAKRRGREREFYRWPVYKKNYLSAFDRMLKTRKERGLRDFWTKGATESHETTATDVYRWWMEYDVLPGQMDLFEPEDEMEETL